MLAAMKTSGPRVRIQDQTKIRVLKKSVWHLHTLRRPHGSDGSVEPLMDIGTQKGY